MNVDLMIEHAAQLITCASDGPRRGAAMGTVAIIHDGAVAVHEGQIVAVGPTDALTTNIQPQQRINAQGKVVLPGFVDPHTHVVYAGNRLDEFEMRIRGASYTEIMAAGGGILSTMQATRQATPEQLAAAARPRLDSMLRLGSTTVEVKSGYGLTTDSELAMLQAIELLDQTHVIDLVPTFMGAHAIPPEYRNDSDGYTKLVIEEMLPRVCDWYAASTFAAKGRPLFNDVFCEQHAFDLAQSQRVLEAGQAHGLPAKIHADEFTSLGGVGLAVDLGAISADHLDVTPADERERLAQSDTVGVVLPAVNFNLGSHHYADARALIDVGAAIALSTDINPGSAPCPSMPLVMAMACRYQRLLPAEVLHAATINAAYSIGMGTTVGSIEVGKQADLLIIDTSDYRHLAYELGGNLLQTVIKQGQIVWNS